MVIFERSEGAIGRALVNRHLFILRSSCLPHPGKKAGSVQWQIPAQEFPRSVAISSNSTFTHHSRLLLRLGKRLWEYEDPKHAFVQAACALSPKLQCGAGAGNGMSASNKEAAASAV